MNGADVAERMRQDWNRRAVEDAKYYVAFGRRNQEDDEFFATAADTIRDLEGELKRVPPGADGQIRRALEIGCGLGRLMRPMSAHFDEIYGVDVSDEMIRRAEENLRGIPHAHVTATSGSDLKMFRDEFFDFVYSYAVFQHIPSREIIFQYLREAQRVLKVGGLLRCQLNGLQQDSADQDTWGGAWIGSEEIAEFAARRGLQLLALQGVSTQYMWITCRKASEGWMERLAGRVSASSVQIQNVTNAITWESTVPARGRRACIAVWISGLPEECDLNSLEVTIGGLPGMACYLGAPQEAGLQQLNVNVPAGLEPGSVPVQLCCVKKTLCPPATIRVVPPEPLAPSVFSVTDAIDLLSGTRIVTRSVKVILEEVLRPEELQIQVGGLPVRELRVGCIDPALPRHEVQFSLPELLQPGVHQLTMSLDTHHFAPVSIEVVPDDPASGHPSVEPSTGGNQPDAQDRSPDVAGKLREIRERLARKFARPVMKPPELNHPALDGIRNAQAAAARAAGAIGTVNPRPPGLANELFQKGKRSLARALEWLVRPQRDFNQCVVECLNRTTEALEATNQNMLAVVEALRQSAEADRTLGVELDSLRESHDEQMKLHRWAYDGALARQSTALQERMYQVVGEVHGQLLEEVRVLRQRMAAQARTESAPRAGVQPAAGSRPALDYFQVERHLRGTQEEIRARQRFYLPFFQGRRNVLDIACGRGEFLELMREANVNARGVDLDADMVGCCREKGLDVARADVFACLDSIPDGSLDGIFCSQFVEHLEPEAYIHLISQCGQKLAHGGVLAVETQNPECLAIFSQSFFLDPTHVRPVPPAQLRVLFAEAGLERISTHFLSPVAPALPVIPALSSQVIEPEALESWNAAVARFNETFFGGMDYAVIGYRAGFA